MTGVINTVGAIQVIHAGSKSKLTTATAVTVAMVPASMFVRCRWIRCPPESDQLRWYCTSAKLSATVIVPNKGKYDPHRIA